MLAVLELANNHCGNKEHGLNIIRSFVSVKEKFPEHEFAFKFQYRDLPNFIHPSYRERQDIKYVKRFMDTALTEDEFLVLKDFAEEKGFKTICTPFDEASVEKVKKHGYDYLKIGSCSATDWPLLEAVANTKMKVILSTGGVCVEDLFNVVKFFTNRDIVLRLLHCVGEYPTKPENFQLNQISYLKRVFPGTIVGFSTHEDPKSTESAYIAAAKGCEIVEKHVDVLEAGYAPNAYSLQPEDLTSWLASHRRAVLMCGEPIHKRSSFKEEELRTLNSLKRGVFVKHTMTGSVITEDDVFLAIPTVDGQLTANDLSKYSEFSIPVGKVINKNEPVFLEDVSVRSKRKQILEYVYAIRTILDDADITVPFGSKLELSHHYGLDNFETVGCGIITVLNSENYCKKYIIVLPGQKHPEHYHIKKDETFIVAYGDVNFGINGNIVKGKPGTVIPVKPGVKHSFSSDTGAIFEEISTTHFNDDSYYTDQDILNNKSRKTFINHWQGKI